MKTLTATLKLITPAFLALCMLKLPALAQTSGASIVPVSYTNVALGKAASASSYDDPLHAATNAIDGNKNTRFASSYDDRQWLSIDLGKSYLISQVILVWESSYGKDYDIQFSNDGTFTDLHIDSVQVRNRVFANGIAGNDTVKTKAGTIARYVRMKGVHRATAKGYSVWEMQVMGITAATGLFPVSVTGFSVAQTASAVQLDWSTITEFNNAGFTIERSNDGINFTAVVFVAGRNGGTVMSNYKYADPQAAGGKNYYRLKQTWNDGRIGYSQVVLVVATAANTISTYPVPVKDHLVVEYKGTAGENVTITLFNASGFPVYCSKMQVQAGQQTMVISRTSTMTNGGYFLTVAGASKTYQQHIILQ